MSDRQHGWLNEQVGNLQNTAPDNKDAWIITALIEKKGIVNAQDVFLLQSALQSLWYYDGKVNGAFSSLSQNSSGEVSNLTDAIRNFQINNNLPPNGHVWPETIAMLIKKLSTPAERLEKLWAIKVTSSASAEFKKLWISFKEGNNNAQLLQFVPWTEFYIDYTENGKQTTYNSETKIGFTDNTKNIDFRNWQFIITNQDNTQEFMIVRPIVRTKFQPNNSEEKAILGQITSQWFEVRLDRTEDATRNRQLYLYKGGVRIYSALLSLGYIVALKDFQQKIPSILDPTLKGREDAEEENRNEARRARSAQETQARIERDWNTFWGILPKSKAKLTTLDGLKIAPQNVNILQQAEKAWFTFASDGSRTNGIYIVNEDQVKVWHVVVYMNLWWQNELVTQVQKLINGVSLK